MEIKPFIKSVIPAYQILAENKESEFLIQLQVQPSTIAYFDPDQMQCVIGNLLSNAIKYTGLQGKVSLKVYLRNQAMYLEVSDTGRGIPEQDLPRIFEHLYRVSLDDEQIEGTDLGLYREIDRGAT